MKLPKWIILGSRRIGLRIGTIDMDDEDSGNFSGAHGCITLNPEFSEGRDSGETLLHEFVHACLFYRGVALTKKQEERVCMVLGSDLHELITRNPQLIKWIQTKGK